MTETQEEYTRKKTLIIHKLYEGSASVHNCATVPYTRPGATVPYEIRKTLDEAAIYRTPG